MKDKQSYMYLLTIYMWTVVQRPDAQFFGTARENYMVKIIMRDVTRSIRTMLELDEDDIPSEHVAKPGHGIIMIEDNVYAFIVPTYNEKAMNAMLKAKRSRKHCGNVAYLIKATFLYI